MDTGEAAPPGDRGAPEGPGPERETVLEVRLERWVPQLRRALTRL